jgi:hypothetical protein
MSRVGDADDTIGQGGANRRAALDLVGGTELRVSGVSGHIGDGQKRAEEEESGELQDPYGTGRRNAKRVGEGSGAQDPYGNGLLNSPISHVGKRSDGQTFKRRNAGDSGGFEGTVERRGNNCVDLGFGPRC